MPFRDRYFLVCTNRRDANNPKGSCAARGSEELGPRFKEVLKQRGLAMQLRACTTSCLDLCEYGATVLVEPDHIVYREVTLADVEEIVDTTAKGGTVERLLVQPPPSPGAVGGG